MNEIIILSLGATTIFTVFFYFMLRRMKKNLRKYVLRFEQIKYKFE
jgi:hypothetical protein